MQHTQPAPPQNTQQTRNATNTQMPRHTIPCSLAPKEAGGKRQRNNRLQQAPSINKKHLTPRLLSHSERVPPAAREISQQQNTDIQLNQPVTRRPPYPPTPPHQSSCFVLLPLTTKRGIPMRVVHRFARHHPLWHFQHHSTDYCCAAASSISRPSCLPLPTPPHHILSHLIASVGRQLRGMHT